jgi:hypothetical protein
MKLPACRGESYKAYVCPRYLCCAKQDRQEFTDQHCVSQVVRGKVNLEAVFAERGRDVHDSRVTEENIKAVVSELARRRFDRRQRG